VLPGVVNGGFTALLSQTPPFRLTEYHNTDGGARWVKTFQEVRRGAGGSLDRLSRTRSGLIEYQAGRQYLEDWNHGVFGPVLVPAQQELSRRGDQLLVAPLLYGDRTGRAVFTPETMTVSVFRDGELVTRVVNPFDGFVSVEVPPEPADYRVEIEAARDERFPLSRQTSLVWTFRSGHVQGDEPVPLPVAVVRFTPLLDEHNTAPDDRPFPVPVQMVAQSGSDAGQLASLTVEVSFDDGQSWQVAPVHDGMVLVPHPEGDG
jgi:hypothetical protein